MKAEF